MGVTYSLYHVRYNPFSPTFSKTFIKNHVEFCQRSFSISTEIITLVYVHLYDLLHLNVHMLIYPWNSSIKPTWSWWMIFVIYAYIQIFASILLRIFASMFMSDICLQFFVCFGFGFTGFYLVSVSESQWLPRRWQNCSFSFIFE